MLLAFSLCLTQPCYVPAAKSDAAFFCCTTITLYVFAVFMVHGVQFAGSLAPDKRVFFVHNRLC